MAICGSPSILKHVINVDLALLVYTAFSPIFGWCANSLVKTIKMHKIDLIPGRYLKYVGEIYKSINGESKLTRSSRFNIMPID